jgi:hypothetical protein
MPGLSVASSALPWLETFRIDSTKLGRQSDMRLYGRYANARTSAAQRRRHSIAIAQRAERVQALPATVAGLNARLVLQR